MGIGLGIGRKVTPRQLAEHLRTAKRELPREMIRRVADATIVTEGAVRERLRGQKGYSAFWGTTGAAGDTLGRRSGKSASTVVSSVTRRGGEVVGIVGSPSKILRHHEEGGVITGKPWLRIPTRNAQTAAGVDRWTGISARAIPGTFLFRSRRGNLLIARAAPSMEQSILYVLVRRVTQRPRRMFQSAGKDALPQLRKMLMQIPELTVRRIVTGSGTGV